MYLFNDFAHVSDIWLFMIIVLKDIDFSQIVSFDV